MPKVNFVDHKGQVHPVDVADGENVMRGALYAYLDGIVGECGGACSCATCHVYIDDSWSERVGPPASEAESELLEQAACPVTSASRLSCQIVMSEKLDGVVVHIPERQY